MKKLIVIITTMVMVVLSTSSYAQSYVTDYSEIGIALDDTSQDGTRIIIATSFLICDNNDLTVVADVSCITSKEKKINEAEWIFDLLVRYKNPSFHPEWDLTTPFAKNDALEIYTESTGKSIKCVENGYLNNARREIHNGYEWLVGSFTYSYNEMADYVNTEISHIIYTQGFNTSNICIAVPVERRDLALAIMQSNVMILTRIQETR